MATPEQPGSREASRKRSWTKRVALALLAALALASLVLALRWPALRQRAGVYALDQVSQILVGDFHVERVVSLSPWNLVLEGVRIDGPDGQPVVTARRLETALHLADLVELQVTLPRVRLDGARVSLRDLTGEALVIAETFLPVEEEEPPPEDDLPPSALRVAVEDIVLTDTRVVDLPDGYALHLPEVRARVRYGPRGTRVEVPSATLAAMRQGKDVAEGTLSVQLVLIEGERSNASVRLSAGDSQLEAKASVHYDAEGFGIPSGELGATLDPTLPARLGLADAMPVQLHAAVQLSARVDADAGQAEIDVQTPGGDLEARAVVQGEGYRLELLTKRLDLRPVLGADAPPVLGGDLELELRPLQGEHHYAYTLRLSDGRVADVWLPVASLEGEASPTSVRVERLRVPKWTREGDRVKLSGRLTEQGRVRVDLDARLAKPLLSGLVRQLSGFDAERLRLEVHGSYDHGSARIDARASVAADGVQGPDVRAKRVSAEVLAQGSLLKPRVDTKLHVERLRVPGATLVAVDAQLRGLGQYTGTLAVRGEHTTSVGSVRIQLSDGAVSLQGQLTSRLGDGRQLHLELGDVTYRDGGVELSRLRLAGEKGDLAVDGRIHPSEANDVTVSLSGIDLASIAQLPAVEVYLQPYAPKGQLSGNLRLRGTFARPSLVAELRGKGLGVMGAELGSLLVELTYAEREEAVRLHARVDPPNIDRLELTLEGDLPPGHRLDASLRRGRYALTIDGIVTDVSAFASLHPELAKVKGGIDLEGNVEGSEAEGLRGQLRLVTTRAAYAEIGPASVRADLQLEPARTELAVRLIDDQGSLANAELEVDSGVLAFADGEVPDVPWTLAARVPRRRLDAFPAPLNIDQPIRLTASVEAQGHGMALGELSLQADGSWAGEPPPNAPAECLGRDRHVSATASLAQGKLEAHVGGYVDGEEVIRLVADGALPELPLDQLSQLDPADARVELRLTTTTLELGSLPMVCGRAQGALRADIHARGILAGQPDVQAEVTVDALGAPDAPTLDVRFEATADGAGARGEMSASRKERRVLHAKLDLPWTWQGLGLPSGFAQVPAIEVSVQRLPLEALSAPVRRTLRLRGEATGELRTRPYEDSFALVGQLSLDAVDVSLSDPALRLENVRGTLRIDERHLRFTDLRWGDREGTLRTSGEVELAGLKPKNAHIEVHAEDLPLRADGLAFATIDSDIQVDAELEQKPAEVRVGIRHLSVELNDEISRSSQDLDQHPDVIYVDSFDAEGEDEADPEQAIEAKPAFVARIHVETPKPFWVRHQDFAVQIQPKLQITTSDEGARIAGPVFVRRGYVNLVGRTFNFERGEIRFAGGDDIDPTVDMVAKHFLSGGEYVQVRIGGYLSRPELTFSTNVAGVPNTETAIMGLLVRGKPGEGSASATAEAAAMLSGLTAGFLSSLTRGKYGEYVPVLALEAGSSTGTRLRAGVQMDDFVPEALRGVVQGAYVEGYVGTGGNDQSGAQGGKGGFLIELYMPHDITTAGAYDEPTNWSIDVLWEPLR